MEKLKDLVVLKPTLKESLRMLDRIPVQDSGAGLECKCCYTICTRCKCGNGIDLDALTPQR